LFNGKLFNGCPQPFADKLYLDVAFLDPSDSPRKLGTGTIEDNRRTLLFNGKLFNGCPQPFADKL
jgi:hypothetical protein